MADIFIIGLPKAIQRRLEGRAARANSSVSAVYADIGKQGTPRLLPHPRGAIHALHAYLERYEDPTILVLQYAAVPSDVMDEVETIAQLSIGKTTVISSGDSLWPQLKKRGKFDGQFLDAIYFKLEQELFGNEVILPDEYIRSVARRCPRLLIAPGALDRCNDIPEYRREFIFKTADALGEFCEQDGRVGPLIEYFELRGLEYAHSGGETVTLEIFDHDKQILSVKTNDHLKQGDRTTPQAAVRLYFHAFEVAGVVYVAILHAGPHPDGDFHRRCSLGQREVR